MEQSPPLNEEFPGLPDRYRVVRSIGSGSEKRVFLAHDTSLDRPVAIAVIDGQQLSQSPLEGLHEAQALARISDHPDVISIHDVVEAGSALYIISQYASGGDLSTLLRDAGRAGLPLDQCLPIALQISRGLAYAHERGVVHQDVKPGNVFLDERGNALLGDLGFAKIHDKTDVGAEGKVSGTPGYMAPEIYVGAEPSSASDLYSLGCVLFELVTGRLPAELPAGFGGDREPVQPHAYAPNLPVILNDLIVKLLEGDPELRPASAREVAAALDGILTAGLVVPSVAVTRRGVSREVARNTPRTAGREDEIHAIHEALARVQEGSPSLLVIQGEGGVGKTQLIQELRAAASQERITALVGRGREDAAIPYQALFEALMPVAGECRTLEPDDARAMRDFLALRTSTASEGAPRDEADRLRLSAALWRGLCTLSRRRPIALVVDDLQWLDSASLDLFEYFVNALQAGAAGGEVRILLATGHRVGEGSRELEGFLARMRDTPISWVFDLEGLGADAAAELITGMGVERPSDQLVQAMLTASEGNPLYLRELVRHLKMEGGITQQHGFSVPKSDRYDVLLPASITAAVERHVQSASASCQALLTTASFLDTRFDLRLLATLAERDEEEVLSLLEEAVAYDLLVDEGHAFRFGHPMIRACFQQRLGLTRRQRAHRDVALTLQQRDDRPREVEIAHHLLSAGPAADLQMTIDYSLRAADVSERKFAWTEAGRFLQAVLAFEDSALTLAERAELHRRAGSAYYYRSDVGPCMHHFNEAIRLFREVTDAEGMARAVAEKYRAISVHGALTIGQLANVSELEDALSLLGDDYPVLRARIKNSLVDVLWTARHRDQAAQHAREALQLALDAGDPSACAEMYSSVSMTQGMSLHMTDAIESLELGMEQAQTAADPVQLDHCAVRIPPLLLMAGQLEEVAEAVERTQSLNRGDALIGPMSLTMLEAIRGQLPSVERHAGLGIRRMPSSKLPWAATALLTALAYTRAIHADHLGSTQAIDKLQVPGFVFEKPRANSFDIYRHLSRIYAGLPPDPTWLELLKPIRGWEAPDYTTVLQACTHVEIAWALGRGELPDSTERVLAEAQKSDLLFAPVWPFLVPRIVGLASLIAGRKEEGEDRLHDAIRIATSLGADAEHYRALIDLGSSMLQSNDGATRGTGGHLIEQAAVLSAGRFSSRLPERAGNSDRDLERRL